MASVHDPADPALFPRLAEEDVRRLADYGSGVSLAEGETVFDEEHPPADFFVVLDGRLEISKSIGGEPTVLAVHERGEFTGDMSLVTGRELTATARALEPVELCRIPPAELRRALLDHAALAQVVFRAVAGRGSELDAALQQTAGQAALGTLSAGLAHELDNPAGAAARAAGALGDVLAQLATLAAALAEHPPPAAARAAATALLAAPPLAGSGPDADPLALAEREDALGSWLEAAGVPDAWGLAGALADAGLAPETLAPLVSEADPLASEALLGWLAAGLEARGLAADVRSAAGRVSALVGAMKAHTYLDQAPRQEVDVVSGLESALTLLGHRIGPGVRVERDFDPELPTLWGAGSELNGVWSHLVTNALDSLAGSGTLRLRAARDGGGVAVVVADTGPGVPPEIESRIFEPFFTTKPVGEGTGLGLDVARRVVRGHGGRLELESRPGDTRFRVWLPLAPDGGG